MYAAAQKALFWVRSMTMGPLAKLEGSALIDQAGRRGPQEEESWMLSARGIRQRLHVLQSEQEKIEREAAELQEKKDTIIARLGLVTSALPDVKTAEAVLLRRAERERHIREYESMQEARTSYSQRRTLLTTEIREQDSEIARLSQVRETYAGYAAIYDQWAGQQADVQLMQDTRSRLEELGHLLTEKDRKRENLIQEYDRCEKELESIERRLREKKQWLTENTQQIERISLELQENGQRLEVEEGKAAAERRYLEKWGGRLPGILAEIEEGEPDFRISGETNEIQAKSRKEAADLELEAACGMIVDENAVENYEQFKLNYDKAEADLQSARGLLASVGDKLLEAEENMIRSTNYEVKQAGDRFTRFMDRFGFDGEVSWVHVAKGERVTYLLNIKARKQGHRGPLTEVNLKGRGGKVGRGVSGGEESLSSLLFALALLKTIQAEPGYIVLDEFDSALDESRKSDVFDLYQTELSRKMLILSPKSHQADYLNHFSRTFVIYHNPKVPSSDVIRILNTKSEASNSNKKK